MGLQHSLVASNLTYGDAKTPLPPVVQNPYK